MIENRRAPEGPSAHPGEPCLLSFSLKAWTARQWAEMYIGLGKKVPYGFRDDLEEQGVSVEEVVAELAARVH